MNDSFVTSRTSAAGPANSLLARSLSLTDDQLISTLFLTVLSRYPTGAERTVALQNLRGGSSRANAAEDLLWSLFSKVDFVFNY